MFLPDGGCKTYDRPVPARINQQDDTEIPTGDIGPVHLSVTSVSPRSSPCGGKGYRPATRQPNNGLNDAGAILAFLTRTVQVDEPHV